jgi:hypothetical protein
MKHYSEEVSSWLKAKYGIDLPITSQEWESRQLSPEKIKSLGLRNPKLSKALVALGVSAEEVATLLSVSKNGSSKEEEAYVASSLQEIADQGNSCYYSSCQATDPRAKYQGGNGNCKIKGDFEFAGKSLFMWVIGEPMYTNGPGYRSRAKLRLLYADEACTELAALYIDRPYGDGQLLLNALQGLIAWWFTLAGKSLPIVFSPDWQGEKEEEEKKASLIAVFCPSAENGYQDNLEAGKGPYKVYESTLNYFNVVNGYKSREKKGGVRNSFLREVTYNPQTLAYTAPKLKKPRNWNSRDKFFHKEVVNFFAEVERVSWKRVSNFSWKWSTSNGWIISARVRRGELSNAYALLTITSPEGEVWTKLPGRSPEKILNADGDSDGDT